MLATDHDLRTKDDEMYAYTGFSVHSFDTNTLSDYIILYELNNMVN